MRRILLNYLSCPRCRQPFQLHETRAEGDLVQEGLLVCETKRHVYPVTRGIPRVFDKSFEQESDFCRENRAILAQFSARMPGAPAQLQERTRKSFGYEWTRYDVQRSEEDNAYFRSKTGMEPSALAGKIVLDAGCGGGRYSRVAGEAGATVIGVDLSLAVDKAASLTSHLPNVHIVQADIFELPFPESSFDFIFSIGVLHHTPNTKRALDHVVPLMKETGEIAIWLYPRWSAPVEAYNTLLRAVTTRMSLDSLHNMAVTLEPVGRLKCELLASQRRSQRLIGNLLRGIFLGVSYHPDREIRICDTFDWFSPPYQWHHTDAEVEGWLRNFGLVEIKNLSIGQKHFQQNYGNGVNFWARRPLRQESTGAPPDNV